MNSELTYEQKQEAATKANYWRQYTLDRGSRYADCRLSNYETRTDQQRTQLAALQSYAENMAEHLETGHGVTLFGPCGTGKDHLATALCRVAILKHGKRTLWVDGMTLFGSLRNSFDGDGKSETEIVRDYQRCPLLSISDPLPIMGELTPFQAGALFRILDARYSARRPTIMTVNVERDDADRRLGTAIVDRLRHSSLLLHCNWPSYRRFRVVQ